ncbi:carboxylating nicotinate-nucleotide diphosphorylase [Polynucleobacter kasalickyi]|uniref:nicotinate-nucleotide diphosphorylase (carboxylating) n=1 Tax=Polynucleobacter kasalickyi TaxID=1938817 RepID=A0A1W1Y451_9BURK|nr:carboxylating nicotinate-nucleotide diphosphorylase [Polynucleobacter kasalickyi]SMC30942.1 nicotinate-nucleotide pyrophosphorylase [carboxylating] [Polynucleobacter kasalickyi]
MFSYNETLEQAIERNVKDALLEDIGISDWTAMLVPSNEIVEAHVIVKQDGAVLCGRPWFDRCVLSLDPQAKITWNFAEGDVMPDRAVVCTIISNGRAILSAERPALNFLQTLSYTASVTHSYMQAIADIQVNPKGCKMLDTRKTLPGLRQAQKYAVRIGGGHNHRMALWDGILIKENHIMAAGSITAAVKAAIGLNANVSIQVEVESITEMEEALAAGAQSILIDDFSLEQMRQAVEINQGRALLEVSGGVDIEQLRKIAMTGVDRISSGKLTKNVEAIDYSMRVIARIE